MTGVSTSPRVVIEGTDEAVVAAQHAALEAAGFSVSVCGGPGSLPGGVCPLVGGRSCPMVDAADVVVHDLDLDRAEHRAVLRTLRRIHADTPIVLELPQSTARDHAALVDGCHVIYPYDMDRFVQAVFEAVHPARV